MNRRRKFLILLVAILIAANLGYFYVKTRPSVPDVVFDFSGNYTVQSWDHAETIPNAIHLEPNGKWKLPNGHEARPAETVSLTIPNIDSPNYWILVGPPKQAFTFGYAIKASRSLAKNGICNFVFLVNSRPENEKMEGSPVLTLDRFSEEVGRPTEKCQTSKEISRRYETAAAEYERTKKLPAILEW